MSDNGTNYVGASRDLKVLLDFLNKQITQKQISEFSSESIQWQFIPERAPHFGGIWEAAVKSMKTHLKKVVGEHKLTFEELYTIITQVEACMNSRPLAPLPDTTECVEVLTPGHFLIGRPLEALPDSPASEQQSISLLKRWQLVQALTRQFWKRWSTEYLTTLQKRSKWRTLSPNINVNDVVIIKEDVFVTPLKWPIARVIKTHPGADGIVRVATVKTAVGEYKRPITKLVPLLSNTNI